MTAEFYYLPKGTHGQILRPYQKGRSISCHCTKLPHIIGAADIVFKPGDTLEDPTYRYYAALNQIGFQLHGDVKGAVMLVEQAAVSTEVPENFNDLYCDAEDELEDARLQAGWSPF